MIDEIMNEEEKVKNYIITNMINNVYSLKKDDVIVNRYSRQSTYPIFLVKIVNGDTVDEYIVKKCFIDDNYNEGEFEYFNLRRVYEVFMKSEASCYVPYVYDLCVVNNYLVTERIVGHSFSEFIVRRNSFFAKRHHVEELYEYICNCGKWLKIYHESYCNIEENMDVDYNTKLFIDRYSDFGNAALSEIGKLDGTIFNGRKESLSVFNIFREDSCFIHGDFGPGNILIDKNGGVCCIDLSYVVSISIFFDIGTFLATLDTLFPYRQNALYNFSSLNIYKRLFLESYFGVGNLTIAIKFKLKFFYYICMMRQLSRQTKQLNKIKGHFLKLIATGLEGVYNYKILRGFKFIDSL